MRVALQLALIAHIFIQFAAAHSWRAGEILVAMGFDEARLFAEVPKRSLDPDDSRVEVSPSDA